MSETKSSTRATRIAALLLAGAALCLWAASRMTWVTVASSDGLGEDRVTDLDGGNWAAATTPLALALVAAIAAAFAVRGWLVRVLGVLVAVVGVVAALPAIGLLAGGASNDRAADIAGFARVATQVTATEVSAGPAVLVLLGSLLALVGAVVLIRKPIAAGGLSSKYDSPAARREAAASRPAGDGKQEPQTQRMLWDALDAGEDPTVDDADQRSTSGEPRAVTNDATEDTGRPGTRPESD
ncbi:TIGR02234 family membrane protein [Rhodococcus spongiicola]|uniref:TIGR02234 family membrane protein n=1 Tax=Rhodococcus spongiicola TaxID=2487352 RepID=A0A3S3AH69_9NOCA|nr:TIGR02234 family membrane protein [Rhodococcus spongiicola]RVW00442.1 TIGR02234 family membrane protein [Rhodococcus spongiicola]